MLLIFDCDGVVLDSMLLHAGAKAEAYRDVGINVNIKELAVRFSGIADDVVHDTIEQETGRKIPQNIRHQIEGRKKEIFSQFLEPISGIREALDKLEAFPRCIASGTKSVELKHMLDIVNLYNRFTPGIYSSEMVVRGKPFPDVFLYAAEQMRFSPSECLVIEDGIAGVQAARAAGMKVLGFAGGSHCDSGHAEKLNAAGADVTFSNMFDLPDLINGVAGNVVRQNPI